MTRRRRPSVVRCLADDTWRRLDGKAVQRDHLELKPAGDYLPLPGFGPEHSQTWYAKPPKPKARK